MAKKEVRKLVGKSEKAAKRAARAEKKAAKALGGVDPNARYEVTAKGRAANDAWKRRQGQPELVMSQKEYDRSELGDRAARHLANKTDQSNIRGSRLTRERNAREADEARKAQQRGGTSREPRQTRNNRREY